MSDEPPTPLVPEQLALQLRIRPEIGSAPRYYVNFAEINVSPYETTLTFALVPARLTEDQWDAVKRGEPLIIEPEVQILLPHQVALTLAQAVSTLVSAIPTPNQPESK